MPSPKSTPTEGTWACRRIVCKASEEAADAADSDADAQGDGEEVAGAGVHVLDALGGFAAIQPPRSPSTIVLPPGRRVYPSESRDGNLFKETENAGADGGSDGCGSDDEQ